MTIEILGRIPSKKNSRQQVIAGNRRINIPSSQYRTWHYEASLQLIPHRRETPIEKATVKMTFYAPDRRAGDLTNKAESIMDLLVDNGILKDDNWFIVPGLQLNFGEVDRNNPRVVVELSEI